MSAGTISIEALLHLGCALIGLLEAYGQDVQDLWSAYAIFQTRTARNEFEKINVVVTSRCSLISFQRFVLAICSCLSSTGADAYVRVKVHCCGRV